MGELRRIDGTDPRPLLAQHLVGRGADCALRLTNTYVSTQHALIRFQGQGWELVDRGSHNGTRLNGELVEPGKPFSLAPGAAITFGHPAETWLLTDAAAPQTMLVALDTGESLPLTLGLLGLPPGSSPEHTLLRDLDGLGWKVEGPDGLVRPLEDGETLVSGGRVFRFCAALPGMSTASIGASEREPPALEFRVSSDEEFVELEVVRGTRRQSLGARSQNYLLLTLARHYLADEAQGLPEATAGWIDKEELSRGLKMTPEQVDGEVHRVRRHFARHGLPEAAVIVERRPRTKQLRIGLRKLRIARSGS